MTPERAREIHAVLEKYGGDRALAAIDLRMTPQGLKDAIKNTKSLNLRWATNIIHETTAPIPPITEEASLHKPEKIEPPVTRAEVDAVQAMLKEDDNLLQRGLTGLNLTEDEQRMAMELAKLHQESFIRSHQIIKSGVTRAAIITQTCIDDAQKWFRQSRTELDQSEEKDRFNHVMEVNMAAGHLRELIDVARRMGDSSDKTMMLEAMVRSRMTPKPQKPGYNHDIKKGDPQPPD